MPSSRYPSRVRNEGGAVQPVEKRGRKQVVKLEESGSDVEEDMKPDVALDDVEVIKHSGTVRRPSLRSSTRIATLASRQSLKQEVSESPSPQRVRKRVKIAAKVDSEGEDKNGRTDDPVEVVEKVNIPGTDKLAQLLAERTSLSDALQVKATIRIFNFMYLEAIQEEDKRASELLMKIGESGTGKRPSKRPDLKAVSKMIELKATLNSEKQVGAIPGVSVGQQFLSRAEMVIIGLHSHWLNGIDYIGVAKGRMPDVELPIAVSIVMSGGYEDDVDNSEDMVYTGQGGNDLLSTRRQIKDQKMEKGNLALKNSMKCRLPVRVIRGHADKMSYTGKVYTYDGLYEVYGHWAEKGISGFTVFKYKLRRLPGQPVLTSKQVHFARGKAPDNVSELRGLVCKDISNGQERIPVPASNTVDDPPVPPTDYTYITKTVVPDDIARPPPSKGCSCRGACTEEKDCACARKNGMSFPYVFNHGGRLVKPMDVVFECGPGCGCGPECLNRTSQVGLQYRLEVYKTVSKGWACRSWDFIPAGAPICEYFGTLRRNDENLESMLDNSYIFELDLLQTMQGMEGRQKRFGDVMPELSDEDDLMMQDAPAYVLDAGKNGSVSRFLNHSCEPNVFIQCVLSHHNDVTMPRIVMFAADNIHPLEELCYDYGYAMDSVVRDGTVVEMACHCGAASCRKRMY
uniref:Uncharacterized protein n=1 Tax=Physcomitrium patens TaxID=3218 RepID=A0A7I4F1F0_PHYPA